MSYVADVIYCYDGTFDGLMCCVFESYERREIPLRIVGPDDAQSILFADRQIKTDGDKAGRVIASIPKKISQEAYDFIRYAFLTYDKEKELYILLFLRQGYKVGPRIMEMLADDIVHKLHKAVKHLLNESHLLKGFIRFSEINHILVAKIGPKNCVLPLLATHFTERYPQERFVIYDENHHMALLYDAFQPIIVAMDQLELPEAAPDELDYRRLWQIFYEAIEIKDRHNPKCRMNLMPKRYWKYMTEFAENPVMVKSLCREENRQISE